MDAAELTTVATALRGFAEIPDEEIAKLATLIRVRDLKTGGVFQRAGDPVREAAFVLRGIFRVFYPTAQGRIFVRAFCKEGMPLGAYSAGIRVIPSDVTIEALEDARVAVVPFDAFRRLFGEARCWEQFGRRLAEDYFVRRERREYELLAMDAKQRLEAFLAEHGAIAERITQANIAAYLGITPVSLSRLRKGMRDGK